ncbi:MAG: pyrroloquinoline quinone-dependent dehydrogenase [Gammaproteobacteria bacterium]|nr:pyrroloquinoline quinone-dependent dehydrogenase [Gammaproteobacteria bacterium]
MWHRCWLILTGIIFAGSAAADDGWRYYGGDQGGRHYSDVSQIDRENISELEVAWIFRSGDVEAFGDVMENTSGQSTPILLPEAAGESLVYCTPFNRIIALNPDSGTLRWQFDPEIDRGGDRPFRCRGVSYAEELRVATGSHCRHRIYSATHDRHLWAVDAVDGTPCAGFGEKGSVPLFGEEGYVPGDVSTSSAPVVANGVIVVGSSVVDFARLKTPRGTVNAYDSFSGALLWQFDPLPGISSSGGANVWAPMSVDEKHGLVYLPTSAPSPDYYGVRRPGDNLYANSVVAVELASGKVRWHFQHVRHDLWDYDSPAQPILFNWTREGEDVPALAQLTKQGFVFVFNRLTGEPLWEITEQPVPPSLIDGEQTAATQPKPVAPPQLLDPNLTPAQAWGLTAWDRNDCARQIRELVNLGNFTPLSEQLTLMFPGSLGGANWGGGALLGDTGILLVNVNNVPFSGRLIPVRDDVSSAQEKQEHPGAGQRMRVTMQGSGYAVDIGALQSPLGIPCNKPPWGKVVAVDLFRGTIDWEAPLGSVHELGPMNSPFQINLGTPNLGGGIATAGGLFFIGATMDRLVRAYDTASGEVVWDFELPVDATATPMTYVYKGRQYVIINAGGHQMFKRGYGDYLFAFALADKK